MSHAEGATSPDQAAVARAIASARGWIARSSDSFTLTHADLRTLIAAAEAEERARTALASILGCVESAECSDFRARAFTVCAARAAIDAAIAKETK